MKILWWRVAIAGVLAEIAYGLFLVAVLGDTSQAFTLAGLAAAAGFMLLGGVWVARSAPSKAIVHGALVGAVAIAFYYLISVSLLAAGVVDLGSRSAALSLLFGPVSLLNHALKIAGGVLGGYLGGKPSPSSARSR